MEVWLYLNDFIQKSCIHSFKVLRHVTWKLYIYKKVHFETVPEFHYFFLKIHFNHHFYAEEHLKQLVIQKDNHCLVQQLLPFTTYHFFIRAYNRNGSSEESEIVTATTLQSGNTTATTLESGNTTLKSGNTTRNHPTVKQHYCHHPKVR